MNNKNSSCRRVIGTTNLIEQITFHSKLFKLDENLALARAKKLPSIPRGADFWGAFPKWKSVNPDYFEAVEKMLQFLKPINDLGSSLKKEYLKHETGALAKCSAEQKGDILILPIRIKHFIESTKRLRIGYEFGFGIFETGCIFLANPELVKNWKVDDPIYCNRDRLHTSSSESLDFQPKFFHKKGKLYLSYSSVIMLNSDSELVSFDADEEDYEEPYN